MGIELDQPTGKNDGSKDGVHYFECRQHHGVLVPKSNVRRARVVKASTTSTPISSGTESIDYATGSGSISLATSGATSGSSGAEATSPSPYASPSIRMKLGTSSSNTSRYVTPTPSY